MILVFSVLLKLLLVFSTILTSVLVLFKLAGSDANKSAIVEKGGLDRLITLSSRFSEDPSVLQEVYIERSVTQILNSNKIFS